MHVKKVLMRRNNRFGTCFDMAGLEDFKVIFATAHAKMKTEAVRLHDLLYFLSSL